MILLDVIEEHIEEADFLYQQRRNALGERVYDLGRLTELEERLLAHLDGLLLAEADDWDLLKPKLTEGDRGEAFAAASMALASGEAGYRDELTKTLDQAEGPVDRTHVFARSLAGSPAEGCAHSRWSDSSSGRPDAGLAHQAGDWHFSFPAFLPPRSI